MWVRPPRWGLLRNAIAAAGTHADTHANTHANTHVSATQASKHREGGACATEGLWGMGPWGLSVSPRPGEGLRLSPSCHLFNLPPSLCFRPDNSQVLGEDRSTRRRGVPTLMAGEDRDPVGVGLTPPPVHRAGTCCPWGDSAGVTLSMTLHGGCREALAVRTAAGTGPHALGSCVSVPCLPLPRCSFLAVLGMVISQYAPPC